MSNSSTFVQLAASGAATLVTSYSLMEKVSQASLIEHLLAPSGALVVIMVYYAHTQRNPIFQIFQILQILK